MIKDFERAEVDSPAPGVIVIRSKSHARPSESLIERIDRRREVIFNRQGVMNDSLELIDEGRERELE
ncbi:MAG TPA: hypothetical protein VJZ26_11700 [Blastocatellia bacterium]|nr:hypothetical protein [Blastocatellia bacterium]